MRKWMISSPLALVIGLGIGPGAAFADDPQAISEAAAPALPLPQPTLTEAPATASDADILVRAQRRQELKSFVASMTPINPSKQLGRWDGRICPVVAGLPQEQALAMIGRIGEVATMLHLKGGGKNCSTPLIVIVDNEANDVTADLARRFPITLRRDGMVMLGNFVRSRKPVRWISLTDPWGFGGGGVQVNDVKEARSTYAPRSGGYPSRLKGNERPAIAAMIVVIDGKQIQNVNLDALSDYVAFVALANPRQGADWPETSVMSLFNKGRSESASRELSSDDLAYLRGLYATTVDSLGQNQRNAIVSRMEQSDASSREP